MSVFISEMPFINPKTFRVWKKRLNPFKKLRRAGGVKLSPPVSYLEKLKGGAK